jgi:hypothetical protein
MQPWRCTAIFGALSLMPLFSAPTLADQRVPLEGFQEVPVVSTTGGGECRVKVSPDQSTIQAEISYSNLEGNVTQAHIHFGQRDVNGGIAVFFCSNLGNGPAGTPACPASPGTVARTFVSTDVINVNNPLTSLTQGITAGEIEELSEAIEAGKAYCNVHSDVFPAGEIRGQLR